MTRHIPPHEFERLAQRERIRAMIEARIEAWIALLDRLDGEADLEPDLAGSYNINMPADIEADSMAGCADDEPSLGSVGSSYGAAAADQTAWAAGGDGKEQEDVNEDGGDINDDPHGDDEREAEHDGREPEPWIGGYTDEFARRFRRINVRATKRAALRQASEASFRRSFWRCSVHTMDGIQFVGEVV